MGNHLKLVDFGLSRKRKRLQWCNTAIGTPHYVAPEIISKSYTEGCDLWSVGVMTFEMLFGYLPFAVDDDRGLNSLIHLARKGFLPTTKDGKGPWFPNENPITAEAQNFIANLLKIKVSARMSAEEAFHHPWISSTDPPEIALALGFEADVMNLTNHDHHRLNILQKCIQCVMDLTEFKQTYLYQDLKYNFQQYDKNQDGVLNWTEFKTAMGSAFQGYDLLEDHIRVIFDDLDIKHQGCIDYEDFIRGCAFKHLQKQDDRLLAAVKHLDINQDKKIDIEEMENILQTRNLDSVLTAVEQESLKSIVRENDGLTVVEFVALMEREKLHISVHDEIFQRVKKKYLCVKENVELEKDMSIVDNHFKK